MSDLNIPEASYRAFTERASTYETWEQRDQAVRDIVTPAVVEELRRLGYILIASGSRTQGDLLLDRATELEAGGA